MIVLVCGGRSFSDRALFWRSMAEVRRTHGIHGVIHGGASGADKMAGEWAEEFDLMARAFPADWKTHGRAAGPMRNQRMLIDGKPGLVVAFPGGRGTADMVRRAEDAEIPVWEVPSPHAHRDEAEVGLRGEVG